ncbi:MAG TPA: aminotransferase class III-fold pyridoxal phosphate-dependent enzyme [Dehalococcoidia bacterium]|nr:aminotransferase class III-fold pyridoxal phosphate-dependent enzyme [Dehalococcoidia bacterium]
MTIVEEYRRRHARSWEIYQEAVRSFPSGVTHDLRYVTPFPIYVESARGGHKWDVDGNKLIDLVMGHGALFLGHAHPEITRAVVEQAQKGTHYGACHEQELEWAGWVKRLIPSAEEVRFTSSGTEATMMAVRLARAYSGRDKLLKFDYHFHGWNDHLSGVRLAEEQTPMAAGIPAATLSNTWSVPPNDISLVEERLAPGDVAAVILEPTGASWGTLPLKTGFLAELREVTLKHHTLLIFDEVITGFRVAVGGAQERYGVTPDITALAKILAGGLPGGCVAGKADILSMIEFREDSGDWDQSRRVAHPGTFNANPVSAAAGSKMLSLIASGEKHQNADELARRLIEGCNQVLGQQRVRGAVYGLSSYFHIVLGEDCAPLGDGVEWGWGEGLPPPRMPQDLGTALKQGMINRGVDLMGLSGGFVSAVHTPADIEAIIAAFESTIGDMRAEGLV